MYYFSKNSFFVKREFYFQFILISVIIVHITSIDSLVTKQNKHQVITFDTTLLKQEEALENESQAQEDQDRLNGLKNIIEYERKDIFKEKNENRGTSYTKALVLGLRDFRKSHRSNTTAALNGIEINKENLKRNSNVKNVYGTNNGGDTKIFVCYYAIPTLDDMPYPVFPENIDPFLCTHILVAFARVKNGTVVPTNLRDLEFYNRTVALKAKNPSLKVMLSIGSSNVAHDAEQEFVIMMAQNVTRLKFIKNSLQFMKDYKFDGLDIDWEFPCFDGPLEQKGQLASLFEEYRTVLKETKENAILSAAVPSPKAIVDLGYDIRSLSETLDFVNLMTYDFHMYTWYSPYTGLNAPLFNSSVEFGFLTTLNTAWSAMYWYQNGMPRHKIIVGIPTYGRSYKLVDKKSHDVYSLAVDVGSVGTNGYVSYVQTCKFMERNGTSLVFHNESRSAYTYGDKEWISFENEQSSKEKAEWAKENLFGGIMVWCINNDDAYKQCNSSATDFPIMRSAKAAFFTNSDTDVQ